MDCALVKSSEISGLDYAPVRTFKHTPSLLQEQRALTLHAAEQLRVLRGLQVTLATTSNHTLNTIAIIVSSRQTHPHPFNIRDS